MEQYKFTEVYQRGLTSQAKGALALNWLMFDLDQLAATPLPKAIHEQLKEQMQIVEEQKGEVRGQRSGPGVGFITAFYLHFSRLTSL